MTSNGDVHPQALVLEPRGGVPNHPGLPAIVYRGAVQADADAIERLFERHQWPPQWRWGIYDFHHFHVTGHEALGVARGRARLMLGGPGGPELEVVAGDVLVLPAGTGHCRLEQSTDFLVVGAYPPGQNGAICRPPATPEMAAQIAHLPWPETDPVTGVLAAAWRR